MKCGSRYVGLFSAAIVLALSLAGTGCAGHRHPRVYDPYYTDYHVWNDDEVTYYRQWSSETHRDAGRDFRKLPPEEQKKYWTWRHNRQKSDHDGDRNNDHR
jgi:hypothetical protein